MLSSLCRLRDELVGITLFFFFFLTPLFLSLSLPPSLSSLPPSLPPSLHPVQMALVKIQAAVKHSCKREKECTVAFGTHIYHLDTVFNSILHFKLQKRQIVSSLSSVCLSNHFSIKLLLHLSSRHHDGH